MSRVANRGLRLALPVWLALLASACAPPTATRPTDPVAEAVRLMSGHFDSRAQSVADAGYLPIELVMQPIWPERSSARWLYVEQAMADSPDEPYRQRVYRLSLDPDGDVVSEVFVLAQPQRFVRGWETGTLAALTESDLEPRPGCAVHLQWQPGGFRGGTRGQRCESHLRGAAWASAEVELTRDGLRSWDRGFDAAGNQVWGAKSGPYRFLRTP